MSRWLTIGMLAIAMAFLLAPQATQAATEAEKRAAINKGLEYLAITQGPGGDWGAPNNEASTGAALLAFLEEGYKPGVNVIIDTGGGPVNYGDVVGDGLTYLLNTVQKMGISAQTAGDPDTNGNGLGAHWSNYTYIQGIVMPAMSRAIEAGNLQNTVITTGAYAGSDYKTLLQDTVDYCAFGQAEPTTSYRGGWQYGANSQTADNSTAQWPPIGMLFAQSVPGASANPPVTGFVQDELAYWIKTIQYTDGTGTGLDGSSGYTYNTYINNVSKTGGLLSEMVFAGDDTSGTTYDLSHPNVLAAIDYINRQWQTGPSGTWYGNLGHPYAMWSVYKGLELTIGTDADASLISNLRDQASLRGGSGAPMDNPDHGWNWWEDYCEQLVTSQNANGSWNGYSSWYGPLAIGWNINILAETQVTSSNGVPLPSAAWMGLALLGAIGIYRRHRRRRS